MKISIETIQSDDQRKTCFLSIWKEVQGPVGKYQSKNHFHWVPKRREKREKKREIEENHPNLVENIRLQIQAARETHASKLKKKKQNPHLGAFSQLSENQR